MTGAISSKLGVCMKHAGFHRYAGIRSSSHRRVWVWNAMLTYASHTCAYENVAYMAYIY